MIVALCYDYHAVIDVGMLGKSRCTVMYCAPCLCTLLTSVVMPRAELPRYTVILLTVCLSVSLLQAFLVAH